LSSPDYLAAVKRFTARDANAITCLRLGLQDLETIASAGELIEAASAVGGRPRSTVLLIDGGPLEIDDPDDLATLIAGQIARLVARDTWLRVFWSATTIPEKPKLKPGIIGRFPRLDWMLYQAILRMRDEFPVVPMFSDYMLEYPAQYAPVRVAPTAKLSYSTETEYLRVMGHSTRQEGKYRNIFPVAAQLAADLGFKGPSYSLGNAYIGHLASAKGKTGNASMWRWCSTDHHLAMVDDQLTKVFGIARVPKLSTIPAEQLLLV
jgi:hypothetical protein